MSEAAPPTRRAKPGEREIEARLGRLEAQQGELLEEIRAIREHLLVVGSVMEQVRDRPRFFRLSGPPASGLALALYRMGELVRSPRQALSFLGEMEQSARETSRRTRRSGPDAPWQLTLDRAAYVRRLAALFGALMFGAGRPHYLIRPRAGPAFPGRRRRVLHVIPNLNVGGSTQLVIDLVEHLGRDMEMQAVTAKLPHGGAPVGLVAHLVPLGAKAPAFAHVLDQFRPELVHLHYWGGSDEDWYKEAVAALAPRSLPVVQNVNTPVPPLRHPSISTYVFVSDYVRAKFAPDLDGALSRVIHPGIDRALFQAPATQDRDAADSVVMVYRLERDKLDDGSIDILIAIAKRRPKTRFLIPGDGPLLDPFIRRTEAEQVRSNFEFMGNVPFSALPALYARAGTFIAPVVQESFGQVVPFAMSMGLAVCGNDVGALSEILGDASTLGRDPAHTVEKTIALLDDHELRVRLAAANAARSAMFDLEGMVGRYADLYERFIPKHDMPGFPPAEIFR